MIQFENHLGKVQVTKEYLVQLVAKTVTNCFGVAGISDRRATVPPFGRLYQKKGDARGIKLRFRKKQLDVELHIIASYGVNLTEIVKSIVHKVRFSLEEAMACSVGHVCVYIDGIKQ